MSFLKKHLWNIVLVVFLGLLFFNPFGLGMKLKTKINRILSFSPSEIQEENREKLSSFDWSLIHEKGEQISLNKMKGEVILINFWATWCPPCIAEMPSLESLYKDYENKINFVLVANDKESKVKAFMKEKGYTMPVYYEQSNTPEQLQSRSIPTTYLIDKQGNIVIAKTGSADWNSEKTRKVIDKLLSN